MVEHKFIENPSNPNTLYTASVNRGSPLDGKEPLYNAGLSLLKKGYSVGVTKSNKSPLGEWKEFQSRQITIDEFIDLLAGTEAFGLCLFTGYNDLEVIDIDLKYDLTDNLYDRLIAEIERQLPGLLHKLTIVKTQSGGYHLYYRCESIEKNQKLAKRETTEDERLVRPDEKQKVLIETRGIGGLIVTTPTPGYSSIQKNEPPLITIEERDTLLCICRSFNEVHKEISDNYKSFDPLNVFETTPWDDYNERGCDDMLQRLENHGWKIDQKFGSKIRFTRPGKSSGTSAEWDSRQGKLYVFTSSCEFENEHGYTPASVFKILECGNDASRCAKELEVLGYGKRNEKQENKKSTQPAINLDDLLTWINSNYQLQRNEITRYIENGGQPMQQKDFNSIYLSAKKVFSKLNYDLLDRTINSNSTKTYNPLIDFIEANKHRRPEGLIKALSGTITTDTGLSGSEFFPDYVFHFFQKWYVSIIASIYGEHSPLMLVLCGNIQGTGKTEWLRRLLAPGLLKYYAESKLDAGKDDEILMCQKVLIMDDEMGGKSKKDEKRLKELLSKQTFSLREPYGRNNVDLRRLAVLCGTTNDTEILSDPTGNRRIIPINVLSIEKEVYNKIDKTDLFMEAYWLYKSGFDWRLNTDDIRDLNKNTSSFEQTLIERDLIIENFKIPKTENDPAVEFFTPSKVKYIIEVKTHQKLNMTRLGMELKKMGCEKRYKKINGQSTGGYFLIDKSNEVVRLSGGWQQ